jgi:hypothetical protein
MTRLTLGLLLLTACTQPTGPSLDAGSTRPALACQTSDRTCSATDARVCFTWCNTVEVDADEPDPEVTACAGRVGCSAVCE